MLDPTIAVMFGILVAAYWAFLFIKRALQKNPYAHLKKSQKIISVVIAGFSFMPAIFLGYFLSYPIGLLYIKPSPAIHLIMSLNLALCISMIGAFITYLAGVITLYLFSAGSKND